MSCSASVCCFSSANISVLCKVRLLHSVILTQIHFRSINRCAFVLPETVDQKPISTFAADLLKIKPIYMKSITRQRRGLLWGQ